jgi:hypothetical protein
MNINTDGMSVGTVILVSVIVFIVVLLLNTGFFMISAWLLLVILKRLSLINSYVAFDVLLIAILFYSIKFLTRLSNRMLKKEGCK